MVYRPLFFDCFPPPLREQLDAAVERLESEDRPAAPLQNRYRDVLAVLIEAGNFQSRLTLDTELRELDGETVEIEVLYFGLASAVYIDRSGETCGIGKPGNDGWTWTPQAGLATSVRKIIDSLIAEGVSGEYLDYSGAEQAALAIQALADNLYSMGDLPEDKLEELLVTTEALATALDDPEKFDRAFTTRSFKKIGTIVREV